MSRTRRLLYALLVSGLALGALELGLRLAGVAADDVLLSPLLFQQPLEQPRAPEGPDGWRLLHDGPMRRIEPRGFRILVVGGSAADGVGVTPFGRFSHLLERRLVQARPGDPVEVINLARAGLASRHVLPVLEAGLSDLSPQLVVVYSGNNELHELRALKHSSPAYRADLEGLRRRLHALHGYRALQRLLARDRLRPLDDGPAVAPGLPRLDTPAEAADRALALRLYREQLELMVARSRQAGAWVMLATVASNADWLGHPDREPGEPELALLARLDRAVEAGEPGGVQAIIDELEGLGPAQPSLARAGQALLRLGDVQGGRALLRRAELLDARPTRSNSELRQAVRAVAGEQGAALCDLAAELDDLAPGGVAGDELFGDGCHLNAQGQRQLAALLQRCVQAMGLWEPLREPGELGADPFRLDHDLRSDGQGFPPPSELDPPGLEEARLGHVAFAEGQLSVSLEHYQRARERGAPVGATALNQGLVRWHLGQTAPARAALREASEALGPDPELDNLRAVLGL
jgi:lysophospholipase L1-like esterase